MVSLEQVKLLESKVTRTIDYVKKVTEENTVLKEKLDSYQKRIDGLEILVHQYGDGILSALNRLNQFEDTVESKLTAGKPFGEKPLTGSPQKNNRKEEKAPEQKPNQEPVGAGEPVMAEEVNVDSGELDIF